ncbi:CPBP family intramembrane glutamic endopeptidase [Streptococcus suis]|uniref:CPBP family intramembrane glutamic endopeptidase n=1 Tax=Streptococcus suis TaxID=1307 RepID=UPI000429C2A6|nr:CPBP family intramembrane glutamic endopeptidase [Streptococcus suis]NQK12573.1 CPBP family intramembrane metalloprotease [Streptococcus suis]HEM3557031.1 CPBP family intramembrane metalloprotease [Streptococcus suis]HEM4702863.1 CPBP family intramembrane metalloprotease [Streptococcus suis]HEM5273830.1 CPBP family intramembrane metalloprotease [Streptococcus suis]
MKNINKIRRNMIIFIAFVTLCGWIGYLVDKSTGQANYENIGTMQNQGTLGLLIWLVSPLICTIILRFFSKDGWKNSGFAPNIKNNKKFYLISFLIYPIVTVAVILLGLVTKGIKINDINMGILGYIWILLTQIAIQFVKNIFEESVWRGYFTNQLLKFNLSDIKLYLLVGFVWWVWHLPYIMIFLTESEIQNTLPVGRLTFFIIGMVVVTCWSVMYTEIFRITKSIWPLVIAHTMEDAVINPLLLYGIVNVDKSHSFLFSLSVGIIPTFFYLMIGLSIRRWRKNQGNI